MTTYDFEVSGQVSATPDEVYAAWLSSERHSAMTGGEAVIDATVGGAHREWDGYINGVTLELEPPTRLVQTWRTTNFSEAHDDSRIEVLFEANDEGTLVRVRHSNVPVDQRSYEEGGWHAHYFTPMAAYFA